MPTIAEQLTQLATIKSNIKSAIEAKGETVGNDAFSTYATHIANISGGGGGSAFRCTNKTLLTDFGLFCPAYGGNHTYTFDGTVVDCAIGVLLSYPDSVFTTDTYISGGSANVTNIGSLKFQDDFSCAPHMGNSVVLSSSLSLKCAGEYYATILNITLNNNNTVTLTGDTSQFGYADPSGYVTVIVVFKGSDGSYDFDIIKVEVYTDD